MEMAGNFEWTQMWQPCFGLMGTSGLVSKVRVDPLRAFLLV